MRTDLRQALALPGFLGAGLELALVAAAGGIWYTQGGWATYAGRGPGAWPLVLLGLMWALRLARSLRTPVGRAHLLPSPVAIPLILFAASAWIGLRAAYDPGPAAAKGWLIVGALGFYWAAAGQTSRSRIAGALAFWALFGAGLAAFFLVTHDWADLPVTLQWLRRLLETARSLLPAALAQETLNPNVAAGALVVVLPFYVPLLALLRRSDGLRFHGHRSDVHRSDDGRCPNGGAASAVAHSSSIASVRIALRVLTIGAALVSVTAWLMTGSRGAWPAVAIAGALWAAWRLWRLSARLPTRTRRAIVAGAGLLGVVAVALLGRALLGGHDTDPLAQDIVRDLDNRLFLARLGSLLARDAPFTGTGLGMYEMQFSIYALLIHVGFVEHSHNMLIDMAIDQGALGAIAYTTMVVTAIIAGVRALKATGRARPSDGPSSELHTGLLVESALASFVAVFLHGFLDNPLYGSRAVLLLFIPTGMLVAAMRVAGNASPTASAGRPTPTWRRHAGPHLLALGIAILLTAAVTVAYAQPWRGLTEARSRLACAWYANRGVVAQARVELLTYDQHRFSELTMDEVRRQEDLAEAVTLLERALQADPTCPTPAQRLAAVALARGDYEGALRMLQRVWDAGARDRVTRLLYGDALVAAGRWEEAVDITRGLVFAEARFAGQAWSRYNQGGDTVREGWARSAAAQLQE